MTKFFLSASTLILGLVFSHIVTAQNPETAEKPGPQFSKWLLMRNQCNSTKV